MVKQMEKKNFLGLDGLSNFWTNAKTWIINSITTEVTAKIAEIVANAPEDLDTLKEIADWIKTHANDASAMNTAILANTEAINGKADKSHTHTKSEITDFAHTHDDRYYTESEVDTKLSGKADKSHTHTKSQITDFPTSLKNPNALTINGKTYDGSTAVDAGVQTVANGGTGVTTQADINKAFIGNLEEGVSDVTDGTEFVSSWASNNGFAETAEGAVNTPYKRQFIKVWNYIKGKISSVLGLTKENYGGTAATILDYVKGTPIKVRWDGAGIDSAEWYPAFNADGSAIEPINRTNIHAGNADKVDNYNASQLWRSDGANWNPGANVTMTPFGNGDEWSFDFKNKNGATGSYWHVWDEDKSTLLRVDADSGKVSAPYGFVGNLSGKADTAGTADTATYAASAGSANSVAWGNVTGKPAYITGSYSNGVLNLYTN